MKCSVCHEEKDLVFFYRDKRSPTRFEDACKPCAVERRKNTPRKFKRVPGGSISLRPLKKKPVRNIRVCSVTPEEYIKLYEDQDGLCKICRSVCFKKLSIDHNHISGEVRGLLCHRCNVGIGMLKDDVSILKSAIEYLQNSYTGIQYQKGFQTPGMYQRDQ